MTALLIITFLALIGIAIWDIKYKKIPSIVLTSMILIIAIVNFNKGIAGGILAGIFGLLMYEFAEGNKTSFGIADIKVMIIIGLLISSLKPFLLFLLIFAIVQMVYVTCFRKKIKEKGEIPFIPVFVIVYAILWIFGGFA